MKLGKKKKGGGGTEELFKLPLLKIEASPRSFSSGRKGKKKKKKNEI